MCVVELRFTKSARRPVSGCVTTTLCSTGGHFACISVRSSVEWPSRIAFFSGFVMSCTARKPSTNERIAGDSLFYRPGDSVVSARLGANRFIWDLHYPGAKHLSDIVDDEGFVDGPVAPPGRYSVRLVSGSDTVKRTFAVLGDPRVKTNAASYAAQFAIAMRVHDAIDTLASSVERIQTMQHQIDERVKATADASYAKKVADAAKPLRAKLEEVRAAMAEVNSHVDEITLIYPVRIYNQLLTVNAMVQGSDDPPTAGMLQSMDDLEKQLAVQKAKLAAIASGDMAAFNALLTENKAGTVYP